MYGNFKVNIIKGVNKVNILLGCYLKPSGKVETKTLWNNVEKIRSSSDLISIYIGMHQEPQQLGPV